MPAANKPGFKPKHNPSGTKWELNFLKPVYGKKHALELMGLRQPEEKKHENVELPGQKESSALSSVGESSQATPAE